MVANAKQVTTETLNERLKNPQYFWMNKNKNT